MFLAISFAGGLRGEEEAVDAAAVLKHHESAKYHEKELHVAVALLGKFKGEHNRGYHLIPMVQLTSSGIELGW